MRGLIKREASQDGVQPVREIARKRDFRCTRKKRAVNPHIVSERSVKRTVCECWPKAKSEKRQHQREENAVFAPEATDPSHEWTTHKNDASFTPGRVRSSELSLRR